MQYIMKQRASSTWNARFTSVRSATKSSPEQAILQDMLLNVMDLLHLLQRSDALQHLHLSQDHPIHLNRDHLAHFKRSCKLWLFPE
ncbi:hypothetical protein PR048_006509 [Dryococelus australis]|uniref:Uncharacterized protein n=1 Tax=Dryococelus australis TaxID=614101 RepID=A0ABQ9IB97_9NEOP|nr:hypothetical protein PR048_006509 [Dryococelus australis]